MLRLEFEMHGNFWTLGGGRRTLEVSARSLKMTCTTASYVPANNAAVLPARAEEYWETQNRMVWNESECATEEQELIYEITWVPELGAWRRFLKSRRKVQQ